MTGVPEPEPGHGVLRYLGWLVHPRYREDVLGDLEEEHGGAGEGLSVPRALALLAALLRAAAASRWHAAFLGRAWGGDDDRRRGGGSMLERLGQDLRFAFRTLRKSPGFTAVVVLTLALGMGATLAVFSVVNGVLRTPLPYPEGDRLVYVQGQEGARYALSYPDLLALRERVDAFDGIVVWAGWQVYLRSEDGSLDRGFGGSVSDGFFRLLGARPAVGRLFEPGDHRPGHDPVVVLGYETWRRFFGGDPGVVGRSLELGGERYEVVGVVEEGFRDPVPVQFVNAEPGLWRASPPMFEESRDARGWEAFWSFARLAPEARLERAQAQVRTTLEAVDPGFDPEGVLVANVSFPGAFVPDRTAQQNSLDRIRRGLETLPGVTLVGAISDLPLSGAVNSTPVARSDRPDPDDAVRTLVRAVAGDYFAAMSIPLRGGRAFGESDVEGSPEVALVNESFVRRLFPGLDPVGRMVTVRGVDRRIVGVVGDVKEFRIEEGDDPVLYEPYAQTLPTWMRTGVTLVVRSPGEPGRLAAPVRRVIRDVDPNVPVAGVRTLEEIVETQTAGPRFRMVLMGLFALVAMVLAAVGTGGVMGYAVSRRLPEMGLRMALGAWAGEVSRMVVGQGARLTLAGVALGLLGAVAASRVLAGFLFGVEPRDPLVFLAGAGFLSAVAILASWLPARRASRVDPAGILRAE